jgi:type IV pilus assembly protein PilW
MRHSRGLTLVEILVAMAVSAIALTGAIVASNTQQLAYYSGNRVRAAQNSARSALLSIEQKVALAGYGMDAPLALDFGWYSPPVALCPADVVTACPRDKIGDSDELVFYARSPNYWVDRANPDVGQPRGRAWWISAQDDGSVTIAANAGDVFRKGQILQAVCSGTLRYAYVTVSSTTRSTASAGTQQPLLVPLEPTDTADPFHRQDELAALPCANPAGYPSLKLFQIDRFRYHVRPIAVGGGRYDPYLVLDTGTDRDGDGKLTTDDEILIAEGIEGLQVAYVFANPGIGTAGGTAGTALTIASAPTAPSAAANTDTVVRTDFPGTVAAGQSPYAPSSFFSYSVATAPAVRQTNAQGNVRRVLVSVIARSPEPDLQGRSNLGYTAGSPLFRLNQNAAPAWITAQMAGGNDGYQRAFADTSVNLPNMTTRTMTYF